MTDPVPEGQARASKLGAVGCCALVIAVLAFCGWWLQMHHVLHIRNASSSTAFTFGVVLDNQPSAPVEALIGPGATATLRFQHNVEAGYVFYVRDGDMRVELGRCGYTDRRINEYRIEAAPGHPFRCVDVSRGGPHPLP